MNDAKKNKKYTYYALLTAADLSATSAAPVAVTPVFLGVKVNLFHDVDLSHLVDIWSCL